MLQQTQVERVLSFYKSFIRRFPTPRALSVAPLSTVLLAWQGLGYNRRAKMLHRAAKDIVTHGMPRTEPELQKLPGVGPYTAAAIAAFASNADVLMIETNIRTAVLHHFFSNRKKVSDKDIARILAQLLPGGRSREWYSALMDYGAHLKRSGVARNAQSRQYAKQPAFSGSLREARGTLLRALAKEPLPRAHLLSLFGASRHAQATEALEALCAEGFVRLRGRRYALAD